jgi:peptidoglycan-N-acetylglucosamine deacetylase
MKKQKSFIRWRLPLLIITIISSSIVSYSWISGQRNRVQAIGQNSHTISKDTQFISTPNATQQLPSATQNIVSFSVPPKFAQATVRNVKLNKGEKYIALTFDDGPWADSTDKILSILHQNNIKATFFMIGENVKNFPQQGKNVLAHGHVIGNHTWHHQYMHMSPQLAASEIESTNDEIYKVIGAKTSLFRPPGGVLNNGLVEYAKNRNDAIILWSADSEDYRIPSVPTLIKRVLKQAAPGGIVLMHDGGGNRSHTITALPQIISKLRQQGYKFVTVPELLEIQDKEQNIVAASKEIQY